MDISERLMYSILKCLKTEYAECGISVAEVESEKMRAVDVAIGGSGKPDVYRVAVVKYKDIITFSENT